MRDARMPVLVQSIEVRRPVGSRGGPLRARGTSIGPERADLGSRGERGRQLGDLVLDCLLRGPRPLAPTW